MLPALGNFGLPEILAEEVQWRLKAMTTLLDKISGLTCPRLFGCRSDYELCRVRGWDKNLLNLFLAALPKRQWLKPLPQRGQALLARLWQQIEDKSPTVTEKI